MNQLKLALYLLIGMIALIGCQPKQQTFVLSGELEGITEGKIIMTQFLDEEQEADSATITEGKFVFEGNFPEPTQVMLMVEDHDIPIYFYIENTEMTLKGHADSLYSARVEGGQVNEDERRFREKTSGLFQKYHLDSLYKAYSKDQDEEIMDQINEASEEMQAEIDEYEKAFIEENPAAFYSAILAKQMSFGLSAEQIEGIIEMLDPALQETDLIQGVAEEMEMLRQTDVSVGSFTNNVPDIGYQVDNEYPGKDHTNIKYLATFPNDDICSLRNDGTLSIIDSKGNLVRDFKTDLTSKPTSIAIDPASGHIYIMGTMTETKEAKFRGKVYKQEVQIGVECLVYDANGKRIRNLNLEDVKTSTGSKIVNGKLFIADYRSRKVAIFNVESGEYESSINDARACCGILDFGVNDKNEILLANLGAFRVQSFDMAGNIQYSFGKRGRGLNDFHGCCNPVNVSYLPNGAIITVEKDPTRIKVYTKSGAHKVEGVQELVKGCSYIPMTTDSKNNLYLASVMSGIVKCSPIETIP